MPETRIMCIFCEVRPVNYPEEIWCGVCNDERPDLRGPRNDSVGKLIDSLKQAFPQPEFQFGFYRNKKTGKVYQAKRFGFQADNGSDGWTITYFNYADISERLPFFRRAEEFLDKFERVNTLVESLGGRVTTNLKSG